MAGRIVVTEHPFTEIAIRPKSRLLTGTITLASLVLWLAAGIAGALETFSPKSANVSVLGICLTILVWCSGAFFVGWITLWMLIGQTVITLSTGQLHFAQRLGAIAEFQKRLFSTHEISRLRVEPR